MLQIVSPGATSVAGCSWICFFLVWTINMIVIWRGLETIKFLEGIGAPFMLVVGLLLLFWITRKAGGFGPVLHTPSKFQSTSEFVRFFIPALTGMVGFWSTVALNIPDFTRYAKSQRAQMVGQALGLPAAMTLYAFIGVAATSASAVIFGEAIWDPVVLLGRCNQPIVALIALVALLLATLNTNVAANVVSPSNDFSNLRPSLISFRAGGLITGFVGILMMPWKLISDFSSYIFGWLVGCSALLGPIAGIMIFDYYLVRRRQLVERDLYRLAGTYEDARRTPAAANAQRSCRRSSTLPDVLRRPVHPRLSHAHRHTQVHQENCDGEFARLCACHSGVESARRHLRACVPGAGIVRRRLCSRRGAQADRHRQASATCHGLRL